MAYRNIKSVPLEEIEKEFHGLTISRYKDAYKTLGLKYIKGVSKSEMAKRIAWKIKHNR